jgi:hypothetical protein
MVLLKTDSGIVTGPTSATKPSWDDLIDFLGSGYNRYVADTVIYKSGSTFRYEDGTTGALSSNADAGTALAAFLASLSGTGVGVIKAGAYGAETIEIPTGVRVIIEKGATTLTVNPASGATCTIEDYNTGQIRQYVSGTLVSDIHLTTGYINMDSYGDFGSLKISGTEIVDSSRNMTNIGTFSGGAITSSSLTASRLLYADASKIISSVSDLTSWIAGTSNEIAVVSDGDGSITLSIPDAVTLVNLTVTDITIGADTLSTTEWAFLDGQDQSVFSTSNVAFGTVTASGLITANGGVTLGSTDNLVVAGGTISDSAGNLTLDDNVDVTGDLDVTGTITGTWNPVSIILTDNEKLYFGTGSDVEFYFNAVSMMIDNTALDSDIIIEINDGGVSTEIMRFDASTSRIGILDSTPAHTLDVNGTIQAQGGLAVNTLTSGRVPFASTNGQIIDDGDFTFATDTLTVTKIAATSFTGAVDFTSQSVTNVGAAGNDFGASNSLVGTTFSGQVDADAGADIEGAVTVTHSSAPVLQMERTTTATNTAVTTGRFLAQTTANMLDGFGPQITFHIGDSAVSSPGNLIASIHGFRDGDDTSGGLKFIVDTSQTALTLNADKSAVFGGDVIVEDSSQPTMIFHRADGSLGIDDVLGRIDFTGDDDSADQIGAQMFVKVASAWSGSANVHPSKFMFYVQSAGAGDGLASPAFTIDSDMSATFGAGVTFAGSIAVPSNSNVYLSTDLKEYINSDGVSIYYRINDNWEFYMSATAFAPYSGNVNSLGTTAGEWADAYFGDGSILYFGNDQDVTLTHVADTGLLLNAGMQLQFRDANTDIYSGGSGTLTVTGSTKIVLYSSSVAVRQYVEHDGDSDTRFSLTDDKIAVEAGGFEFVNYTETTQNVISWNVNSGDVDYFFYTDTITALAIAGDTGIATFGATISGDITGNAGTATTAGTVTTAAQPNITSVGTLTALTVDNININGVTITGLSDTNTVLTAYAGRAIAVEGVTFDGGVVASASSITSTNFYGALTGNVTGNVTGTAATVTGAAQASITSLGTLTTLQVDNININLNTISSTAGTDLIINPLAGQQLVLDGTIVIDAGVLTGVSDADLSLGTDALKMDEIYSDYVVWDVDMADGEFSGIRITDQVDQNTTGVYGLLHIDTDGHWVDADKDASTTIPCMAMAIESGTGSKMLLMKGMVTETSWSWTAGATLYVGDSGAITDDISGFTTGDQVQIIGYAKETDTIYFNPSQDVIEI